jgi:hypothetical protein
LVIYREGIRAFAETARALQKRSAHPVTLLTLDPKEPLAGLRRDVRLARPAVVVALGPLAQRVATAGLGRRPVVFAYGAGPPRRLPSRGAWLRHGPAPAELMRWAQRLRPGLSSLGVLVPRRTDPRLPALRRAARRQGIRLQVADVRSAGDALSALVSLLGQRPQAVWLGTDFTPWTPARLRAALRLQGWMGVPVLGITAAHVRKGLALAIDADPVSVATSLARLLRAGVPRWRALEGGAPRRERTHRARRRSHSRRDGARDGARRPAAAQGRPGSAERAPEPGSDFRARRVSRRRVSINPRTLRVLGLSPTRALAAGATEVHP